MGLSATKCLIRIRHPADAGIARLFHARQNGLIGTQESLKAASQEAGPEEFTQCLVSRMDIGFRAFDSEKYHQKYHHFSVRLLCGAFETL